MSDPLAGVRVLDFTLAAVGPFCTRVLRDLGAEVIHVEWPRVRWKAAGDDRMETRFPQGGLAREQVLFAHVNAGKQSLAVNLKTAEGVQIVRELVHRVDVVVENMTPRVMRQFGLAYESLRELNPRIVMCSLTGFGQEGIDGDTARGCTDPVAQAMSGISWLTGERDGPPYAVGGGIGDTVTAMTGVAAILAALVTRERTDTGTHIDLSMVESLAYVDCLALPRAAMAIGPGPLFRNGQQNSYTFPMGPFRASGGYIALQAAGAGPDSPWGRLCHLMGRDDLLADERLVDDARRLDHVEEVIDAVEAWLCSMPDREAALTLLAAERIPAGPILSQDEMLTHRFFTDRGTFGTVDYPGIGAVGVVQPPFKFSDGAVFVRGPAPEMGEHSRRIVGEELQRSDDELERLFRSDVLYESGGARLRNQVPAPIE